MTACLVLFAAFTTRQARNGFHLRPQSSQHFCPETSLPISDLQQIWKVWNSPVDFDTRSNVVHPLIVLVDDASRDFTIGGSGNDLIVAPPAGEGEDNTNETPPTITDLVGFGLGVLDGNPVNANDVDGDGFVSPIDVLQIINDLNQLGPRELGSEG